jgi:transposase
MYNNCMPKRLSIQAHLSLHEVETRYRRTKDAVVRSHWQVIWLLAQGLASAQVAVVTGYTVNWIRTMARRYNQQGPAGLEDRRHRNPGATGLLSTTQRAALAAALEQPPPDGGIWTGPQVAAWMATTLGHAVHPQRGWEQLRRLNWTPKVPRPHHAKADLRAQAAFIELHQSWFTLSPACLKNPRMRSGRRRRRAKPRSTPARRSLTPQGTALRKCCLTLPWHPSSGFRSGA